MHPPPHAALAGLDLLVNLFFPHGDFFFLNLFTESFKLKSVLIVLVLIFDLNLQ